MNATPRSYRCFYIPQSPLGSAGASDCGVLPFVQVRARNGEAAFRAARHLTGCAVESVERLEGGAA